MVSLCEWTNLSFEARSAPRSVNRRKGSFSSELFKEGEGDQGYKVVYSVWMGERGGGAEGSVSSVPLIVCALPRP